MHPRGFIRRNSVSIKKTKTKNKIGKKRLALPVFGAVHFAASVIGSPQASQTSLHQLLISYIKKTIKSFQNI